MNRPEHAGIVIVGGGQAGGWAARRCAIAVTAAG